MPIWIGPALEGEHKVQFPTNTTVSYGWQGSAAAKLPKSAPEKGAWSVVCSSWVTVTGELKEDSQLTGIFFSSGHLYLHQMCSAPILFSFFKVFVIERRAFSHKIQSGIAENL